MNRRRSLLSRISLVPVQNLFSETYESILTVGRVIGPMQGLSTYTGHASMPRMEFEPRSQCLTVRAIGAGSEKISTAEMKLIMIMADYTRLDSTKNADIRGCIQKFPDRPSGERTANGTALCH